MNSPYLHSPTSGHWWSRSKSPSKLTKEKSSDTPTLSRTSSTLQADAVPDTSPKPSSMFGNFTSVIRLKPKKNVHTIAIQEPPKSSVPLIIPPSNSSDPYGPLTSRPYSKAVSAVTLTDEDSIDPKAPVDLNLTYQKPFVGFDPFAATSGVIFSSKEPQHLDRLFIPPDSHVTKGVPASSVSPQTAHRRHRATNPHVSRERLVSEVAAPTRGPAAMARWGIFTSSPQFSDQLTFTSQNTTERAGHTVKPTDAKGVHERRSSPQSRLEYEVRGLQPIEEQRL